MKLNRLTSRHNYLLMAAVTIVSLLLTACAAPVATPAPQPAAPAATEAPPPAPTEAPAVKMLELYHDKGDWGPNTDAMGKLAAEQIGIGFTSIVSADTTNYQTTVRAALGSDKAPDLFTWWSGYRMEDIVNSGSAADLTDIWQKYIDAGEYTQGVANAFAFNGKVYAVPFLVAYWVVYYNKHVFDKYGLQPPTTWDEFMQLNETLKAKGVTPLAMTISGRWPAFIVFEEMVLRTAGPEFYNRLMRGEAKYTDPEVVTAMELWQDLIAKGYFSDPGIGFGTTQNDLLPLFQQGQVAMIPIGDWYSATLVGGGMKPGVDYDAFIMPNQNPDLPPALFFEAGPLLVGENSPNKEDAKKVAEWWMSVPAQNKWSELMGFSSANSKAAAPNVVGQGIQDWISANNAQLVLRYWEATPPDIVETAVDELGRFMTDPSTLQEVLQNIQQKADEVWASRQ